MKEYADFVLFRTRLQSHRPDGLANLAAIGGLSWSDLAEVLNTAALAEGQADEKEYARRAHAWLERKGITRNDV